MSRGPVHPPPAESSSNPGGSPPEAMLPRRIVLAGGVLVTGFGVLAAAEHVMQDMDRADEGEERVVQARANGLAEGLARGAADQRAEDQRMLDLADAITDGLHGLDPVRVYVLDGDVFLPSNGLRGTPARVLHYPIILGGIEPGPSSGVRDPRTLVLGYQAHDPRGYAVVKPLLDLPASASFESFRPNGVPLGVLPIDMSITKGGLEGPAPVLANGQNIDGTPFDPAPATFYTPK